MPAAALLGLHAASFVNTPLLTRIDAPRRPQYQISASTQAFLLPGIFGGVSALPDPSTTSLCPGAQCGGPGLEATQSQCQHSGSKCTLGVTFKTPTKASILPSGSVPSPDTPLLAGRRPCARSRGKGPWFSFSPASSPCTGPRAAAAHGHSPPAPSLPRALPKVSVLPVPPAQNPQPPKPPPRGAGSVRCPYSFWVKASAFPRFFSFQFLFPIRSQKSLQILSAQLRGNTDRHLCRGSPWISPGSQEPHTGAPRFPHQPSLSFPHPSPPLLAVWFYLSSRR